MPRPPDTPRPSTSKATRTNPGRDKDPRHSISNDTVAAGDDTVGSDDTAAGDEMVAVDDNTAEDSMYFFFLSSCLFSASFS